MKDFRLVHFFGPDGSGKSTQADLLIRYMEDRGIRVRRYWVRSPHTIAFILWKFFVRIGFYRTVWTPFNVGVKLPLVNKGRIIRLFWSNIEFLGVLPLIAKANLLMRRGYKLVAERYVLDTVTTIAFFMDDISFLNSNVAKLLLRFVPKNSILIFIDADFHTIFERRKSVYNERIRDDSKTLQMGKRSKYGYVPDAGVESREFIDFQRKAYGLLSKSLGAYYLYSPDFTIDEMFNSILKQCQ